VSRLLLISCLLVVAGCGVGEVAAGVEVVESRSDVVAPADATPVDGSGRAASDPADLSTLDRISEMFPPVDIVAGSRLAPRPRTVAVVGDSLTLSAVEEIETALVAAGLRVLAVDGAESRRMARSSGEVSSGADAVELIQAGADPELWVIALGTNDVGAQSGDEVFREDVDRLLDLLPPDVPIIWVDLWIRDMGDQVARANGSIRSRLAGRQGVAAVVDWHAHGEDPGIITRDGVHLTNEGQQLFADSMANAIATTFEQ
jgi:lysophospholipase L1-like esterase